MIPKNESQILLTWKNIITSCPWKKNIKRASQILLNVLTPSYRKQEPWIRKINFFMVRVAGNPGVWLFGCQMCANCSLRIQRELVTACHYRTEFRSPCNMVISLGRKEQDVKVFFLLHEHTKVNWDKKAFFFFFLFIFLMNVSLNILT